MKQEMSARGERSVMCGANRKSEHTRITNPGRTARWHIHTRSKDHADDQPDEKLLANTELTNHIQVTLRIVSSNVIEQPTSATDQTEQAASRSKVFAVRSHVLGQTIDPLSQNRNLHLRGSGVICSRSVFADYFLLTFFRDRHTVNCFLDESNTEVTCHPRQTQVKVKLFSREV
ncbi:hypothetical protein Poly21_00880 [Allorhodopirellula heiligendammensis]|uniref:Uncharacterized protein n=1 Tax=Allorhodopirellula heiligendammensis TaxID=2714739 RepID=A0A5C6C349_9BACT|nr:hypothetical protein Poly21_00880 [Allorhodopirellula heiligendammensis]